jgi:hypothetical protein
MLVRGIAASHAVRGIVAHDAPGVNQVMRPQHFTVTRN